MLGYSDSELATLGGYDLVHYDDLSYIASAHQECKLLFIFSIILYFATLVTVIKMKVPIQINIQ